MAVGGTSLGNELVVVQLDKSAEGSFSCRLAESRWSMCWYAFGNSRQFLKPYTV